ncbi:MAG: HAD-IC family P-type ATPase, partial [Candidatus Methanomethylophilaceae archaeon]|nr:HAD-IC family P-type ATPase [Candidatus Methanomethylophilaceae archaeon]
AERVQKGEVNSVEPIVSRSYSDIIIKNVCTTFNLILFILGAILLILDEPINALAATFVIIFNICIATLQEMKAKRRLDKIALLMRPRVIVVRDGEEKEIDQSEIVRDDVIILNAGDQALVDGEILEEEYLELDESLLTGESRTVKKHVGEQVYSGSYCITGKGYYRVTAFGDESFASKMLASAKKFRNKMSPLQIETTAVTKLLMSIAFIFFLFLIVLSIIKYHNFEMIRDSVVLNAVIVLDIVPIALFLLIVIAYMIAAVRMAESGVLLQRSNSVESMSHVDTVCMDKTGTITTNKLLFKEMKAFIDEEQAAEIIRIYSSSTGSVNKTVEALIKQFGKCDTEVLDEIRFSSERKFSAVKVRYGGREMCIYLGALSSLGRKLDTDVSPYISEYSSKGLRTVIIALSTGDELYVDGEETIPDLKSVAVVAIEDEVRPDCRETLDVFFRNGMDIKVISGDDPHTVDSLFTIANIPGERKIISGEELDALSGKEKTQAILETNIFGRMKPDHKEMIVATLKNEGRYVAMVGDGVNDVKSLKMANVGVALQSGSGAARGVADMVLVNDNFGALPKALVEGRRTVSGMRDVLKVYLSRNFLLAVLVLFIL